MNTQYALWHPEKGVSKETLADSEYHSWVRFWNLIDVPFDFEKMKKQREAEGWRARKVALVPVDDARGASNPHAFDGVFSAMREEA